MKRGINGLRILNHMSFQFGLGQEEDSLEADMSQECGERCGSLQSFWLVQDQNDGRFDSSWHY